MFSRAFTLGVTGYLPEYLLWGYPATYQGIYSGGTRVIPRVFTLGVPGYLPEYLLWGYPGTYPSIYSGVTPVPTRVFTLGVPGYLPGYLLWGNPGTYSSIYWCCPGTYPSIYSGGTRVPTRVLTPGVPGCPRPEYDANNQVPAIKCRSVHGLGLRIESNSSVHHREGFARRRMPVHLRYSLFSDYGHIRNNLAATSTQYSLSLCAKTCRYMLCTPVWA